MTPLDEVQGDPAPGSPQSGDEGRSYADAVAELEHILAELEDDTIDVDVLAARVKEAAELLRFCRRRLDLARVEIEHVIADLDAEPLADVAP